MSFNIIHAHNITNIIILSFYSIMLNIIIQNLLYIGILIYNGIFH